LYKQERDCTQVRDELLALEKVAQTAGSFLGAVDVELVVFPDNLLDSLDCLHCIKQIEECVQPYQPDFVYDHHAGGVNVAYLRLCESVVTAGRPAPGHVVKRLLSVEVACSPNGSRRGLCGLSCRTGSWIFQINGSANGKLLCPFFIEMSNWLYLRILEVVEHLGYLVRYGQMAFEAVAVFCMPRQLV